MNMGPERGNELAIKMLQFNLSCVFSLAIGTTHLGTTHLQNAISKTLGREELNRHLKQCEWRSVDDGRLSVFLESERVVKLEYLCSLVVCESRVGWGF